MRWGRSPALRILALFAALAACDTSDLAPRSTAVKPAERPTALVPPAPPRPDPEPELPPSRASRDLARYYANLQADLLARGLMRTDGGGPDTAFTDTMLVRNFERVALAEEYTRGQGLRPSDGEHTPIKKWIRPIRMSSEFGPRVPRDQIDTDRTMLSDYAARLSRVSGHPITMTDPANANFHVLFMSEDDRDLIVPRIQELVPDVDRSSLYAIATLPRTIHCLVIAFSDSNDGYDYGQAIAIIRTEHPELLRRSCIHEEIAQGMGLVNDSPHARPSIFNDDDEFALLTTHDEMLLKMLYDPRIRPGMTAPDVLPIVRPLARQLVYGGS